MPIIPKSMEPLPLVPAARRARLRYRAYAATLVASLLLCYVVIPWTHAGRQRAEQSLYDQAVAASSEGRHEDVQKLLSQHQYLYPDSPRRAEGSYLYGMANLRFAEQAPPEHRIGYLEMARPHFENAARLGYGLREGRQQAVALRVDEMLKSYAAVGDLEMAQRVAESFADPAQPAMAALRADLTLLRDRADLASRLSGAVRRREIAPSDGAKPEIRAAELAQHARRLAAELVGSSTSVQEQAVALRAQAEIAFETGDPAGTRLAIDRLLVLHDQFTVLSSADELGRVRFLRGRAALMEGDFQQAIREFEETLRHASPSIHEHRAAQYLAGRALLAVGRPAQAEARFQALSETEFPLSSLARLELAWRLMERDHAIRALPLLESAALQPDLSRRAAQYDVDPADIHRRLASLRAVFMEDEPLERLARVLGHFADRFDPGVAFRTDEARVWETLAARADRQAAEPDLSREAVERLRTRERGFLRRAGDAWVRLAGAEAERSTGERLDLEWAGARNYFDARAYPEAARAFLDFTSWSADDPRRSEAFYRAGVALQRIGFFDQAVRAHQHTLDEYPDSPAWTFPARLEQALCWLAMGEAGASKDREANIARAVRRLQEILYDDARLNPQSKVWQLALFHLGRTEVRLRESWHAARRSGGADPRPVAGDPAMAGAARTHLTEFLQRYAPEAFDPGMAAAARPTHSYAAPAAWHLGALEQMEGRYAEADAAYAIVVALGADAAPPDTGVALGADAEPPDADEIAVLAAWPDYVRKAHFARGDCLLAAGRYAEAERVGTAALERYDLTAERVGGYLARARARLALRTEALKAGEAARAAALSGAAERDLREARKGLAHFRGHFERSRAGDDPGQRPYAVWSAEIAAVEALLHDRPVGVGG